MPIFVAAGTVATGTTSASPALPAGWALNDILVLGVETGNQTVNAITGYSNVGTGIVQSATGAVTALTVRWKRATGSESAPSVGVTSGDHIVARLMAIRGCVTTGTPFDTPATGTDTATGTGFSIPGGTTLGIDRLIVAAIAVGTDTATAQVTGTPTNASLAGIAVRINNWSATGNGGGFAMITGEKAVAGAYSATAGTLATGNTKAMMSFALIGEVPPPRTLPSRRYRNRSHPNFRR
jgi:hypothetical protein